MIEMREIPFGTSEQERFPTHQIAFLMKGRIEYKISGYAKEEFTEGRFLFVPIGRRIYYEATEDCLLCIVRITSGLQLCSTFSVEQLYDEEKQKEISPASVLLETNSRLWHFLDGLRDTCSDGIMCRYFFEGKIKEMFVLLRAYYSDEQLRDFFLPVLSSDTNFSERIRGNFHNYNSVNDMISDVNMTHRQFTRRFRRVFSQAPRDWMKQEKTRRIHEEICNTTKPYKQIADEFGFTNPSCLYRFCRENLGATPNELRENRTGGVD